MESNGNLLVNSMKNKEVDQKIRKAVKYCSDYNRKELIFNIIGNLSNYEITSGSHCDFSIDIVLKNDYVVHIKLLRDEYIKMWKVNNFSDPLRTIFFYTCLFVPSRKFIKYIKKKNNLTNKEIYEIVNKELFKCL